MERESERAVMKRKRLVWAVGAAGVSIGIGMFAYVVSGLTARNPDRAVFSPEWGLCDSGDACVAVEAPCGEWQSVNRKHAGDAAAYYGHLITVVETTGMECVSVTLSRPKPAAYCVSGACELAP